MPTRAAREPAAGVGLASLSATASATKPEAR